MTPTETNVFYLFLRSPSVMWRYSFLRPFVLWPDSRLFSLTMQSSYFCDIFLIPSPPLFVTSSYFSAVSGCDCFLRVVETQLFFSRNLFSLVYTRRSWNFVVDRFYETVRLNQFVMMMMICFWSTFFLYRVVRNLCINIPSISLIRQKYFCPLFCWPNLRNFCHSWITILLSRLSPSSPNFHFRSQTDLLHNNPTTSN